MSKSDDKSRALGDDPLAWLSAGTSAAKQPENKAGKKEPGAKNKSGKKAKSKKKNKIEQPALKVEQVQDEPPSVNLDPPKVEAEKKSNRLVLESSLVINKASDIYESLKNISISSDAVEIDASNVEVVDSASLQLLFAFVLNLKERGISWSWYKPSEGMLNKASILGLTEQLGL